MKLELFVMLLSIGMCLSRPMFDEWDYWNDIKGLEDEPMTKNPVTEGEMETGEPATVKPASEGEMKSEEPSPKKNEEAKWIFQGDWEEKVEGELVAGKEFEIVYDAARLPGRSTLYGQKAWNIYAEFKFNDGDQVHEETLDGPEIIDGKEIMAKKIFMPFGTSSITMWFKHWGYYSGETYDSDYGKNYKENVSPPKETSIVFDSDWGETAYGELEKSGKFAVYYDHKRLGGANNTYAVARYSDSSNYTYTHELKGPVSGSSFLTTTYDIPSDAEKVILWFYTGEGDERIYDSDYGKDYEFPLKTE